MAESAKAKKAPQELTDKQLRFRRLAAQGAREGAVIALIALAIYLAMALVTFSPSDPGWASIGHDTSVQNYAGRTGAWLASLFMDFFGHVAYLFPLMIAGYALMLIRRRNDSLDLHWPLFMMRFGGFLLILLSATSLLSLYSVFGLGVSSGGVLGTAVSEAMVRFFNLPATTLLLIAIFLFALTVTTGLSWFWLMDRVGGLTLKTGQFVAGLFQGKSKPEKSSESTRPRPGAPAAPVAELPVVRDRVAARNNQSEKAPPGKRWWQRLPGLRPKKPVQPESGQKSAPKRVEPALDGFPADTDQEPARL